MVRFFFDVAFDGVLTADDTGLDFARDEAAQREALKALTEMATEFAGSAGMREMAVMVRDESGARLCTVTLALSVTD